MAASLRLVDLSKYLCSRVIINRPIHTSRRVSSKDEDLTPVELVDEELQSQIEAEIEAKRDVCRLPPRYEPWLKSRARRREPVHASDLDIRSLRKEYARLGAKSGIDPSIMWPTVEEIKKREAWEAEWEPSLEERLRLVKEKKLANESYIKKRTDEVDRNLENLPKLLKAHYEKQKKKDQLQLQLQEKRNKMLQEAREYFGYEIDPREGKFQEMIAKREEDERLAAKKEKRAKRLASKTAAL